MDLNALRNGLLQNIRNLGQGFMQTAGNVGNAVGNEIHQLPQQVSNVASTAERNVGNYFNPNNVGSVDNPTPNFWTTPVAQGLAKVQQFNANAPRFNFSQDWTQNIQNPVKKFAAQMVLGIPENLLNTPSDILRSGNQLGTDFRTGQLSQPGTAIRDVAAAALPIANIATLGGGTVAKGIAENVAKDAGYQALWNATKEGAITGAKYGGGFGALQGLSSSNDIPTQFVHAAQQGFMGAGMGLLLGGITGGASNRIKAIQDALNRTPQVEDQLRNAKGQWVAGDMPIKPKGMSQSSWNFQQAFNKQYNRNPYEPVTHQDLYNAVNYETQKRGIGLSIRDVSKDQNPLGATDLGNQMDHTVPMEKTPPSQLSENGVGVGKVGSTPKLKLKGFQSDNMPQETQQTLLGKTQQDLSLAQDTRQALTGQAMKERGFVTSVKEAKNTPQAVKDLISGSYVVKSNEQLKKDALTLIKSDPQTAEQLALNPKNDTHVQIGNELINHYGSQGQFDKAQQVAEGMAKSGTEFGRAVQAFSQYDKTTPQGALRYAQQKINEYNKLNPTKKLQITDAQVKDIFDKAHAIQAMPEGRDRNIAANELLNTVSQLIPSSFADKAITVWKAGLLTSLRTHERNLLSNTVHGVAETAKDLPATLIDKALSLKTGQRTLTPTLNGVVGGAKTGLQAAKDIVTKGYDPNEAISKYDVKQINWGNSPLGKGLKLYTDSVFRTLGGEDKPFYNAAFARSLYDQAGAAAINAGKSGDKAFIENLVKNPTPEMLGTATKDANVATFHDTNKLTEIGKAVQNAKIGPVPVGQILAPFVGVPSSVAKQLVAYSPIGLLNGIKNAGRVVISSEQIPGLQRQAAQEIGRGVIGSGLIGLGTYLASKGLMTGQPKDPQEAAQWKLQGKQPNSVLIGGQWRSINSVGPEALLVLAGAKAQEQLTGPKANPYTYGANLGKDFLGQTFLQGVQGPLNAVSDPTRYGQSYVGGQAASVVPNIVKDASKALDPNSRQSNSILDYVTNSIPLVRNQNLPQRDALGNPIAQSPTGAGAFVDLFNSTTPISNPVVNELGRLNDTGNNATPSKLTKDQTINGVKMTLNPQQIDTLTASQGPEVTKAIQTLIQDPTYQSLPDQEKQNAIQSTVAQVRKQVRGGIDLSGQSSAVNANPTTTQSKLLLVNPDTGNIEYIDMSKYAKTPVTATAKAKLDNQRFTDAEKILKSSLPDNQKLQAYKQMNVDPTDVAYYDNASQSNDIKSTFVQEQLSNFQGDHQALLSQLVQWRKDVAGKQLLTSSVISDLVDNGTISKQEGSLLNNLQYKKGLDGTYQLKQTGRVSGGVKVSMLPVNSGAIKLNYKPNPRIRLAAPARISVPNVSFATPFTPQVGVPQVPNFKAKIKFNL